MHCPKCGEVMLKSSDETVWECVCGYWEITREEAAKRGLDDEA